MLFEEALTQALRGNAVLFTGAGFSFGAQNALPAPDNMLPTARQFAAHLSRLLGIENGSYDLPIISEFFKSKKGTGELINELIKSFNVTSVAEHHKTIARVPWRRVYTTNYDNCFEMAATQAGLDWIPITLDVSPTGQTHRCVHVNGFVSNLTRENIESQIKLTHSSYSSDSFASSKWAQQFRQDIANSKAIFFVG